MRVFIQPETGKWVTTNEAVLLLKMSRVTLMKRRRDGFFRQGVHYLKTGESSNAPFLWDCDACLRRMAGEQLHS